jgi:carbon-monoxide dehydrogenase medium subunit
MIPAAFAYARPTTLDEALQAVADGGEDVKIMAGGQSLIPVMRLRLAAPETVVDLTRVPELRGVREDGDSIVIGAMTTHSDVIADPLIARYAPLIAQATETVADRQVRHRGTFGGALAHADPAGDLAAVALALDADFVLAGPGGSAHGAGRGLLRRLPHHRTGGGGDPGRGAGAQARGLGHALREVQPGRPGLVDRGGGRVHPVGERPDRRGADRADQHGPHPVAGARCRRGADRRRGHSAAARAAEGTSPSSDLNAQADYRQHLVTVLTRRAVSTAVGL